MSCKYLLIILFLLGTFPLYAQTDDINFRRISPPGGYSFQAVTSINQDIYGYIWMGSFDGIIRYNSKQVERFSYNPERPEGLPSNIVTALAIDKKNNIWASTDRGLCLFNHKQQQFEHIHYRYENGEQANNNLVSIELDGNGNLWIADEKSFGYFDPAKKKLFRISKGLDDTPRLLYNDETNRMWLGSNNGSVYLIHPETQTVSKMIEGPGSFVRTIYANNSEIWVGYESHGARLYDIKGNLKTHYSYAGIPGFNIKSASIRKIWRDTRGQIWIGSYHGLFLCDGKQLFHFIHDEYEGLPHNSIYTIFEDEQGGIWIGTWSGGVAYLHRADNKFNNYRHSKEPFSISDNMVSSFLQTHDKQFYVGTEQDGMNRFDQDTKHFTKIKELEQEGVLNIKALHEDKNGGIWVGCAFKGLYYRPKNQSHFIHFEQGIEDGNHISERGVYALCSSDSGVWIGTNFGGIDFYNFKTKRINFLSETQPFSSFIDLNIRSLTLDSRDNLWVTTALGAHKIHLPTKHSTIFSINSESRHKTKSESFYTVSELKNGEIWMGTGGEAISIYHPGSDSISYFDAQGLLRGKDVYGIIEGDNNNLWITSNDGLILHNTKDQSSRRFVITDGIQGNLFNPNAIYKDRQNNLYFGGTNGFTQLEPKKINKNNRAPNILINSLLVNNQKIVPHQTEINKFAPITLSPNETTLNFDFSADNYLLPEKNRFKYRLTNYIDDWVPSANNGSVTFVNIPAGDYIFEVKACNNDGVWNETPASLPITIRQFWYKSHTAYTVYLLIVLTVILLIVRFYRERSKLKKALLIEKIKHEHEEQLNEMKLRFFTNISHEFRTPLTLISGPVKNLLKSKNLETEEREQLETVKRNTNRLLQLINQIMDLRKVEKGLSKLNISKIELIEFANERILNFSEEAKSKNIRLVFQHEAPAFTIEADEEKLDKIIYNLLSNAFKYTPQNGQITVSIQAAQHHTNGSYFSNQLSFGKLENEDAVEITVTDNGQGIDSEYLPNVFERYEQGKPKSFQKNSSGIGLSLCKDYTLLHRGSIIVQSTPGEGTRFSVRIPTRQKAQKIMYNSHETVKNIKSWESNETQSSTVIAHNPDTKILIVEDNEDLRKYLIQLLQKYYMVLFAENGKRGLDVLKTQNIDLIVSDVMMPEMDGFEFCQTIKSQIETSHIPVILLTALSSVENTTTGLDKGADAYISKPFDDKVLLSQINNLITQRKKLKKNYAQRFIDKQTIDVGSLDNYFLNKINTIVEENLNNENLSVDLLAQEMRISRSQLHRKLKQITNHSTSEYINIVKIRKAISLLSTKNYNIDEVAFKVGFNSPSYFAKCFKKIHGQSPKEYMKSILK